jgi:hypothetical protein
MPAESVSIPPTAVSMPPAAVPQKVSIFSRVLSGLEACIIGGLAMLAILAVSALQRRHVWWETPNLLASTFYGTRAFRSGPGVPTLAGAAFELTICGLVGSIFGCVFGGIRSRRLLLPLGAIFGVGWYYLADTILWSRINPLVSVYSFAPAVIFSHLLFGACLGFMGRDADAALEPLVPADVPVEADTMPDAIE